VEKGTGGGVIIPKVYSKKSYICWRYGGYNQGFGNSHSDKITVYHIYIALLQTLCGTLV
jgi:hypothetical protein